MKDDLDLAAAKALLAHEADEPVPQDHERRIREGLGALLAMPVPAPSPPEQPEQPEHREPPEARQAEAPSSPQPPAGNAAHGAAGSAAVKWIAVGLVAVAGAGVGFAVGRSTAPAPAPASSLAAPSAPSPSSAAGAPFDAAAPGTSQPTATLPSAAPTPTTSLAPLPSATPTASAVRVPGAADPGGDAFDREQSLLERARSALVRHDAAAAELALAESERSFPRSRHAEERDYLRIQVFRERGDAARTREHARAFIARYPDSLLRSRVEPLTR